MNGKDPCHSSLSSVVPSSKSSTVNVQHTVSKGTRKVDWSHVGEDLERGSYMGATKGKIGGGALIGRGIESNTGEGRKES